MFEFDLAGCEEESRKALEKYGTAPIAKTDPAVVKRRWRIFVATEFGLLVAIVALFLFARQSEITRILAAVLSPLLVIGLPVAFLYLIGKPMVMTLGPLVSSRESRAMTRDVRRRAPLSDDEFYLQFYAASAIPRDTIARLRNFLRKRIDPDADRLHPGDYLPLFWDELDFADVFYMLNREYGGRLRGGGAFDGTLDSLIRYVESQVAAGPTVGADART